MDWKLFGVVFGTIFVAELGDKTQLATLLYASRAANPALTVFVAAASALVLTSAIGVVAGMALSRVIDERILSWVAGTGFIAVGIWILTRGS